MWKRFSLPASSSTCPV
jgi:transcriptional/translational regulatory protein YebC/TACO1